MYLIGRSIQTLIESTKLFFEQTRTWTERKFSFQAESRKYIERFRDIGRITQFLGNNTMYYSTSQDIQLSTLRTVVMSGNGHKRL